MIFRMIKYTDKPTGLGHTHEQVPDYELWEDGEMDENGFFSEL